jgi:hypothetical protein
MHKKNFKYYAAAFMAIAFTLSFLAVSAKLRPFEDGLALSDGPVIAMFVLALAALAPWGYGERRISEKGRIVVGLAIFGSVLGFLLAQAIGILALAGILAAAILVPYSLWDLKRNTDRSTDQGDQIARIATGRKYQPGDVFDRRY